MADDVATKCSCVTCDECNGTGNVWFSFDGRYLGKHHMDNLDHLEMCPECDGAGIVTICEACEMAMMREQEDDEST